MDNRMIGVFDSGLGGLTVVKELQKILPNESIVYFGDTGRVPYGSKSDETISKYVGEIFDFLSEKDVKAVVSACGTASSVIMKENILPKQELFTGVVVPACLKALETTKNKRIGLIGTKATVNSGAYERFIKRMADDVEVFSCACPLFVPLVENGMFDDGNEITTLAVKKYLSYFKDKDIDTLILGCTHYPLITSFIEKEMGEEVALIDSGKETAYLIKTMLEKNDMFSEEKAEYEYYVSDSIEDFSENAERFLGRKIKENLFKKVF